MFSAVRRRIILGIVAVAAVIPPPALAEEPGKTLFELGGPDAVIEWVTDSTFRFCRAWEGLGCDPREVHGATKAQVSASDDQEKFTFATEYLQVEVEKRSLRLKASLHDGNVLLEEEAGARRSPGGAEATYITRAGERFYGLGTHATASADLRGRLLETSRPFLISGRGFGLYYTTPGLYRFDLAATDAGKLQVSFLGMARLEFWFHYGPTVKAIYEEHVEVVPPRVYARFDLMRKEELPERAVLLRGGEDGGWEALEATVRALVHASLSGILSPAFDVGMFAGGPAKLYRRAMQLASVFPLICDSFQGGLDKEKEAARQEWLSWRKRLTPFFWTYFEESRSRGLPMIHPMVMQFPRDVQGQSLADQFMLGDEILAAPILNEQGCRKVYLPMGQWTELHTNRRLSGRQTLEICAPDDVLPLFAKNGSIVPLDGRAPGERMELHYFPQLAGELFLYEPLIQKYSQMHAAPALDLIRLEIDARAARDYEWVVHHMPPPAAVTSEAYPFRKTKSLAELRPGMWHYDAARQNIHIAVAVEEGERLILHIHPSR